MSIRGSSLKKPSMAAKAHVSGWSKKACAGFEAAEETGRPLQPKTAAKGITKNPRDEVSGY